MTAIVIPDDANWIDLLDLSAAQGVIDFQKLAAAKVAPNVDRKWRGIITKVAEGESYKDPTRVANIAGARSIGLPWGAYVFIHLMQELEKQIENALAAIGDTMPSFALMLDVESADPSLTPQQIVDRVRRARDATLERFGRPPKLYSYPDFWTRRAMPAVLSATDLAELGLHWASYGNGMPWYPRRQDLPKSPDPWKGAGKIVEVWQYSGNTKKWAGAWTGWVDGVHGDVDRNVFTGSEEDFLYDFCGQPRPDQLEKEPPIVRPPIDF